MSLAIFSFLVCRLIFSSETERAPVRLSAIHLCILVEFDHVIRRLA